MATTTNYSWTTPDDTALVKDGAAAIRSLGTAIDTTVFNNASAIIAKTIVDAKGDIIAATAADTVARLAVGSNNSVLTADSSTATGLKWATPAGGGKVLQVVMGTTTTATTIASTSFTDTTLTASITPSSATSKVLVFFTQAIRTERDSGAFAQGAGIQIVRDSTAVFTPADSFRAASSTDWSNSESGKLGVIASGSYLDTPATTSATTYKTQARAGFTTFNGQIKVNESGNTSSIILMEIGA
jgi:hypothetical protein